MTTPNHTNHSSCSDRDHEPPAHPAHPERSPPSSAGASHPSHADRDRDSLDDEQHVTTGSGLGSVNTSGLPCVYTHYSHASRDSARESLSSRERSGMAGSSAGRLKHGPRHRRHSLSDPQSLESFKRNPSSYHHLNDLSSDQGGPGSYARRRRHHTSGLHTHGGSHHVHAHAHVNKKHLRTAPVFHMPALSLRRGSDQTSNRKETNSRRNEYPHTHVRLDQLSAYSINKTSHVHGQSKDKHRPGAKSKDLNVGSVRSGPPRDRSSESQNETREQGAVGTSAASASRERVKKQKRTRSTRRRTSLSM